MTDQGEGKDSGDAPHTRTVIPPWVRTEKSQVSTPLQSKRKEDPAGGKKKAHS